LPRAEGTEFDIPQRQGVLSSPASQERFCILIKGGYVTVLCYLHVIIFDYFGEKIIPNI